MSKKNKIKLLILDDKHLRLDGIKCLLRTESEIEIVETEENACDLQLLLKTEDVNVLVVMGRHYVEALNASKGTRVKIVVLTSQGNVLLGQMIAGGVKGVALETSGRRELLSAIRCAARNETYIDSNISEKWDGLINLRKLSTREIDVFHLVSHGKENIEIAQDMKISESTVKNHVSHILKKLDLQSRTKIAVFAWSNGLARIPPENLLMILKTEKRRLVKKEIPESVSPN